ncbi:MAG TPA: histidinol dehydrogenase, partial [Vicinamibacterales bacterium]|nr:histidinol dehydrogenase [Vicinamibacterales bacterium]
MIRILESGDEAAVAALLDRAPRHDVALERRVARIVNAVRKQGDRALLSYAARLDGLEGDVEVTPNEMRRAAASVASDVQRAIATAARNIRHVARRQVPHGWTTQPVAGVSIEQRVTPLDRVGCYVPGGRYPLPSSLLMTAIPASVAGVREIIAVCPKPDATVMAAALEAGVTKLLRLGGAHAIAALAYGTATVPRVDKIVGPGNAYVAAAKALVAADCAIDFFAGPSEILIVSTNGRPAWIAADLIAQAEHDENARAIFVTTGRTLANAVAAEIARQMPADGPARAAIARNGAIVVTRTIDAAIALSERMAPEHVVCDSTSVARRLRRAGT